MDTVNAELIRAIMDAIGFLNPEAPDFDKTIRDLFLVLRDL